MDYRKRADLVFLTCFLIFAAAFYSYIHFGGPWQAFFYFVAQSALIGSAADWFAVTALFEKPLGFPWHTDLIRRHRGSVIQSVRNMVENRLIRPDIWNRASGPFSAVDWLSEKLQDPLIIQKAAEVEKRWADRCTYEDGKPSPFRLLIMRFLDDAVYKRGWSTVNSPMFIVSLLKKNGNDEKLVLLLLGRIKAAAGDVSVHQTVEQMIRSYVSRQSENPLTAMAVKVGEMTGVINYKDITDSLLDQTARTINEWEDSMHPMHEKLKTMLYDFAGQMGDDPDIGKEIQRIADGVRRGGEIDRICRDAVRRLRGMLLDPVSERENWLDRINRYGIHYLCRLAEDPVRKKTVDDFFHDLAETAAAQAHRLVGEAVENVLKDYGEERLNSFIRSKVSRELSWIRINGAVTGALAGAVLYALIYEIYIPLFSFGR